MFQKGDKVRCIEDGFLYGEIKKDQIYTVKFSNDSTYTRKSQYGHQRTIISNSLPNGSKRRFKHLIIHLFLVIYSSIVFLLKRKLGAKVQQIVCDDKNFGTISANPSFFSITCECPKEKRK